MVLSWFGKSDKPKGEVSFEVPRGYRDSEQPLFARGEVLSSTYQIRALLRTEASGQVYDAWDMLLDRPVALKGAWRDADTPPLLQEARAPGAVRDPCVADVYSLGRHREIEYVVAERIEGPSLCEHIGQIYATGGAIFATDASELLGVLCRGVAAVHDAGLRVPYLSTKNVVLADDRRLVFSQFALGQGALAAPIVCFAPELLTGAIDEADVPSPTTVDLYALGIIAVELLLGRPPFQGDSLQATKFSHVHERPPNLMETRADVPAELSDLVGELLAKDPARRPPSAGDVAVQLRAISQRVSAARRLLRVLVVDDDTARVRPLWSALRRAHARTVVDAACDADEAIAKLRRDKPDVLIVNMDLPGSMNGLELCMYCQGAQEVEGCVIIALSDAINPSDAALLQQLGAQHILPIDDALHPALGQIIRRLADTAYMRRALPIR